MSFYIALLTILDKKKTDVENPGITLEKKLTELNHNILDKQNRSTLDDEKQVLESLHYIKESGYKIIDIVESGNLTELGKMFDEHWEYKKKLAKNSKKDHLIRLQCKRLMKI